jgi:MoaA/NifB/PqqE/SkfB family radical SAM enzyme
MAIARPSLWLELTPYCNLDCQFCYNPWRPGSTHSYPQILPYADYLDSVQRLVDRIDFSYVTLSGGEPLLYRQLDDLVNALHERRQHTILTTNGQLLHRSRMEALQAAGLSAVQVPILAATPELHDELARKHCWRAAVLALTLSLEFGLHTVAIFVTTASNVEELPLVLKLVAALGGRHFVLSELQPVGSAAEKTEQLAISSEAFSSAAANARDVASELSLSLRVVRHADGLPDRNLSGTSWSRWTLTPSAELKLCNFSAKTIGRVSHLTDEALDRLIEDYQEGRVERFAHSVDNCACLRLWTSPGLVSR